MKRILLLFAIISILMPQVLTAGDNKNKNDATLRKSNLFESVNFNPDASSCPMPFRETSNPINKAAISMGYYFVDSDDQAPDFWRPQPGIIDTTVEPNLWFRIVPGPRIKPKSFWDNNPNGLHFFRNPAIPDDGDFFNKATDSTDDAIAGPMPISFDFYFNGLKYDSFYVSTNGIIALTNRRYLYDDNGNRIIPQGKSDCYSPMSMDWFYEGRRHSGNGLRDTASDDFGYIYSVCGGNPLDTVGGIRAHGGHLNQEQFLQNKSAVIAPFFGDLHLSQYNADSTQVQDWGKVYVKRDSNKSKLIIYYLNAAPVRELSTPFGQYNGDFNLRPGVINYISVSAQVTLDKRDSSITIVYERLDGVAVVNGRGVPASIIFRYNTTVGVHGFARHTNYGQPGGETKPWAGEYQQYTHYFSKYENPDLSYDYFPHNYLAVKFKQWKNILRVVDISYRVRKRDRNADLKFTETVPGSQANNYELLAGDERLGAIQPVGIIQNVSNEIQGQNSVNYQQQELNFKARITIMNEASGRIVYNRIVEIDSSCLANNTCNQDPNVSVQYVKVSKTGDDYNTEALDFPGPYKLNGIPPYGFAQVFFPPFEPNEYINNHIGRLTMSFDAIPTAPETEEGLGDLWPFDDTIKTRLFVMTRLEEFMDDVTSYHVIGRIVMPNTLKWVNIDAEVNSGDRVSKYPAPPRGKFPPTNNVDFNFYEPDFTTDSCESPCIRMSRKTLGGKEPATSPGGDELRSFPIDLRGRFGAVLSLSIQRTTQRNEWPRGYSYYQLVGPEPRTLVNGDPFTVFSANGRAVSSEPDELVVEFAKPNEDGINGIVNIPEENWRYHPRRDGAKPVTDMPVLSLYGGGGYMVGWLENDRDSALSRPARPNLNGLRPDIYDDGIDFEYKKYFLTVPDTFIKTANEGAKNFRFRIKMMAKNNQKCIGCIPDDDDPYFIDNVNIIFPCECSDVELINVKIIWPYTIVPVEQAIKIPVRVKVITNTMGAAPPFRVKVKIYHQNDLLVPVYNREVIVPFLTGRTSLEIPMPDWNAGKTGDGEYFMIANLMFGDPDNPDQDMEPLNDTNYTKVKLKFGDDIAYDPVWDQRNDVSNKKFTDIPGRGLNITGFSYGGTGNINEPTSEYDENKYGAGYLGGNSPGQIAMKFTLYQRDTLYGYKAYFCTLNCSFDDISLATYFDDGQPSELVDGSFVYKFRSFDDIHRDAFLDEYVTYLLPEPLVLDAGSYWMAVGQLGETGLELGASATRMGMRTTNVSIPAPLDVGGDVGLEGCHLLVDKTLRHLDSSGNYVNTNLFAYRNGKDSSGEWMPFMPTVGNPGYAHLHHFGTSTTDNYTLTLTRGTWIPLIRPYFGTDHLTSVPIESVYFDGVSHRNNIELFWETPAEYHIDGFYVQKRLFGGEKWHELAYISSEQNNKLTNRYKYFDKHVVPDVKYQYRLHLVDRDGSFTGPLFTDIITLMLNDLPELSLEQNIPNPAGNHTSFTFSLPQESYVELDVFDLFGKKIKSILSGTLPGGKKTVHWNLADDENRLVHSGTYLVRLTAGNDVRTIKITVIR